MPAWGACRPGGPAARLPGVPRGTVGLAVERRLLETAGGNPGKACDCAVPNFEAGAEIQASLCGNYENSQESTEGKTEEIIAHRDLHFY